MFFRGFAKVAQVSFVINLSISCFQFFHFGKNCHNLKKRKKIDNKDWVKIKFYHFCPVLE